MKRRITHELSNCIIRDLLGRTGVSSLGTKPSLPPCQ